MAGVEHYSRILGAGMKRAGQPSREGLAVSVNPVDRNVLDLNRQIDEDMAAEGDGE